jgi:DNA-binding winged helix-turn-helix (wHTH) protein/tetratricopeptide (TPR) repeat protein/TolB-like protein
MNPPRPGPKSGAHEGPSPWLAFGPFELDPDHGILHEGDQRLPLDPKPLTLLLLLLRSGGRVVSRAEILEAVWPEGVGRDEVVVRCVVELRRALRDDIRHPRYVRTIPRHGYQFVAEVTEHDHSETPRPQLVLPFPAPVEPPRPQLVVPRPAPSRRRLRLAVAAGTVALAAVLAVAAFFWTRRGAPETRTLDPDALVVMPVSVSEPRPESGYLRQGLPEMIRSQLGQTPGLKVLPRHQVDAALAEAGYAEDQAPSPAAATEVARKLGAERIITGSFVRVDEQFVINAQLVDASTGRAEASASVRGRHPGQLLEAVDELTLRLLHHLRPPDIAGTTWRPSRLTTGSVEAERLYLEALDSFARGGRDGAEQAESRLGAALKLDPAFAQAYVKKAEVEQWRRRWGYGDPDPAPAVRAAARLVKDLPDRERLLVQSFEALVVERRSDHALEHWNALLRFYPAYAQDVGVPGLAAETFQALGRWEDAIMIGEAHVDAPSLPAGERALLCSVLAQAFRRKGEFGRSVHYARQAVASWPQRHGPRLLSQRTILGRVALEAGLRSEALAEFRAVRDAREADVTNLTDAAWGFYMAGQPREAAAVVARAIALDPNYGNAYHLRGWLEMARGDDAGAAVDLETAFERTPRSFGSQHQGMVSGDLAARYYAGVAALRLGQKARAYAVFASLISHCKELIDSHRAEGDAATWQAASFRARAQARLGLAVAEPPRLQGDDTTYFVQSARLHAVAGRHDDALRELARGIALGHGEFAHLQDDPDFDEIKHEPDFWRLVNDRVPRSPSE